MNFYLIDGSALFYRAYFAFIKNPLINSKGENVSAVYGFINSILSLMKTEKPDYICIAFDRKEPTFRHNLYSDYKANREKMPEDLSKQLPLIFDFVDKAGIASISLSGYEADDIIATLAKKAAEIKLHTFIVSGDKDLLQLIGEYIKFFNIKALSKNDEPKIFDDSYIKEKYGIPHNLIGDYLSLIGDASDNIPGVTGVGKVTASKLLKQYKSLKNIYDNINSIKPDSLKKKLIEDKDKAFLSRELVTLCDNIEINNDINTFKTPNFLNKELFDWIHAHEFNSLKKYFNLSDININKEKIDAFKNTEIKAPLKKLSYTKIENVENLKNFFSNANIEKPIALSIFEEELNKLKNLIFAYDETMCALDVNHLKNNSDLKTCLEKFFEDKNLKFIGFETKKILKCLWELEINKDPIIYDLCIAGFLLDSEIKNPSIDDLYSKFITKDINIEEVFADEISKVFAKSSMCLQLFPIIESKIRENHLQDLLKNIELPLINSIANMEHTGVLIDIDILTELSKNYNNDILKYAKIIHDLSGEDFNINSPKQLGDVLFEKLEIHKDMGFKKAKTNKTGFTTSSEVLMQYKNIPIIDAILKYRMLTKLENTYVSSLIEQAKKESGRIHCTFNQTGTVTGRLSSNNPNMQNIPIKTKEGSYIRQAFIASKNYKILSADYSQIELRILAHLSGDNLMLEAFEKDHDIHSETAAKVYGKKAIDITKEERNKAKAVNFGVIYGMGPFKLSQDTGMKISEAKDFITNYFSIYKGVKSFIEDQITLVRKTMQTRTLFGRIRYLPDINSSRKDKQILAEHMAINTPIQGTAADLIKVAMVRIYFYLKRKNLKSRIIMQVHDELILEIFEKEESELAKIVKYEMENVLLLRVPLKVSTGIGLNWLEAH